MRIYFNRPKLTLQEHIGALIKGLYSRFILISGDFISDFYYIVNCD